MMMFLCYVLSVSNCDISKEVDYYHLSHTITCLECKIGTTFFPVSKCIICFIPWFVAAECQTMMFTFAKCLPVFSNVTTFAVPLQNEM